MGTQITVADVLAHPVFQNSDTFATNTGLHKIIGTCTIMDIENITAWLNADDVLIVGDYTENCLTEEFVDRLHEKEISCLITKKKFKQNFTSTIIEKFYAYDLPIILVTDNYAWSTLIKAIQQIQFEHYQQLIAEQENFYQSLLRSLANPSSFDSIGSIFHTNTQNSLAIITPDKKIIDASFDINWINIIQTINLNQLHDQSSVADGVPGLFGCRILPPHSLDELSTIWAIPVYANHQLKYYILVGFPYVIGKLPIDLAKKIQSVSRVLLIKDDLHQELDFEQLFKINESFQIIIDNPFVKESDFLSLQSFAGIKMQAPLTITKISSSVPRGALFENSSLMIQNYLTQLLDHLIPTIVIYYKHSWLLITDSRPDLNSTLEEVLSKLNKLFPNLHFHAGSSNPHSIIHLPLALSEAEGALQYLQQNHPERLLQTYQKLGITQLFLDNRFQINKQYVKLMIDTFISPLLTYDQNHNTELLNTLGTYLDNDFSRTKTSKALFIHKNTLSNRINKIKQLVGSDHEDLWLNLQISYHLWQNQ